MNTLAAIPTTANARKTARTHLFVGATLYHGRRSAPVRVRNMSPSGALIEFEDLPDIGALVILRRGSLEALGAIAWKTGNKAGVAFSAAIDVLDWMPHRLATHQVAVDAIITDHRSARQLGPPPSTPCPIDSTSIEAVLTQVREDLCQLGSCLTEDAALVAAHPEIQALDIAVQCIDRVLREL